jgi:hypothetical protein
MQIEDLSQVYGWPAKIYTVERRIQYYWSSLGSGTVALTHHQAIAEFVADFDRPASLCWFLVFLGWQVWMCIEDCAILITERSKTYVLGICWCISYNPVAQWCHPWQTVEWDESVEFKDITLIFSADLFFLEFGVLPSLCTIARKAQANSTCGQSSITNFCVNRWSGRYNWDKSSW